MIPTIELTNIVNAIWITEGGTDTKWPYGIKHHYKYTSPRQACMNTVEHFCNNHPTLNHVDRYFIYQLSSVYVPKQDDKIGNEHWRVNIVRIMKL